MLLQEARYYGKCKELLEIEECAEIIRQKCLKNPVYSPIGSKENKRIEELLCKLFNFEKVDLAWEVAPIENSMTISQTTVLFPLTKEEVKIKETSNGIRFVNSKGRICLITTFTALFTITKLTAGEWVSVLLHEVGHNFYNTRHNMILRPILLIISSLISLFNLLIRFESAREVAMIVDYILTILTKTTRSGRKVVKSLKDIDDKYLFSLIQHLGSYGRALSQVIASLINQVMLLIFLPLVAITSTLNVVGSTIGGVIGLWISDGYRNEKFSDNFATMYGYGAETTSVQTKFSFTSANGAVGEATSMLPVVGLYYVTLVSYVMGISSLGDEHPASATRIKDQKRYLETYLNENKVNKKQRDEIMAQIEEIDKNYEDLYKITRKSKYNFIFVVMVRKLFREMGMDEDFKEAFFANHDQYNWHNAITDNIE